MTGMETFGEQIKRRRRATGLTQEQLADLAGVSRTTLRNAERGRHHPRGGRAEALLGVLERAESGELLSACERCADIEARTADLVRGEIADLLEALVDAFPEELFPDDPRTPEALRVMRQSYRNAARIARTATGAGHDDTTTEET